MCDVLLIGDVQTLQTWFDGWIGDATNAWMQVETVGDALSICNQVKPKIILVGDHSLKKRFAITNKTGNPIVACGYSGAFF
ncbi:MAG: hypothetical protein ACO36I_21530 [Candidatus Latescibacterota bacterium]